MTARIQTFQKAKASQCYNSSRRLKMREKRDSFQSDATLPSIKFFESFHQVEAKVLSYTTNLKGYQNREAARFFNVDELNIRLWRKN
ncbi:hypothetical protein TNCV_4346371 [Trichonephila clavipes]|nr:hypothetical protein TNCV_4346371 [Trichonephila clavipes]